MEAFGPKSLDDCNTLLNRNWTKRFYMAMITNTKNTAYYSLYFKGLTLNK